MRIAVVSWSQRRAGGVQTYLEEFFADAAARGHALAHFTEVDAPADRSLIALPAGVTSCCAAHVGERAFFDAIRSFSPDVVFSHGVHDPSLEERIPAIAPAVFFAHAYYGTCISGTKTHSLPVVQACTRAFGPACLAMYFPRRCGGKSPITMVREYRRAAARHASVVRYRTVVTLSEWMRQEYVRNGVSPERVVKAPYLRIAPSEGPPEGAQPEPPPPRWELLVVGRLEALKGPRIALEALPELRSRLGRPVRLTLAGDGSERAALAERSTRIATPGAGIEVELPGWLGAEELSERYERASVLLVPSVWPEPFGLVGLEANRRRVPVAAFDVGAVGEWLRDGVNGVLARATPASPSALADAVVACVGDPARYARLRAGARWIADRWDRAHHLDVVLDVLERAAGIRCAP